MFKTLTPFEGREHGRKQLGVVVKPVGQAGLVEAVEDDAVGELKAVAG
jgi:hypothetical protein